MVGAVVTSKRTIPADGKPMAPRFPRLSDDEMSDAQRQVAEAIASGPRGGVRGPFVALLHSPELASRVQGLGEYLRFGTAIPPRLLELAVLVTSRQWTCQFEWYAHAPLARKAGLAEPIISDIASGRRPAALSEDEAAVYDFCTELHETGRVADATFAAAEAHLGRVGVLELVAVCGYYTLLAMVLNVADFPLPDGTPGPLPPTARVRRA